MAANNIVGVVSTGCAARARGTLPAFPRVGGLHRATVRRLLIALGLLLLALLVICGVIAYVSPGTLGISNIVPGIAPSTTVTITPASTDLKNTYTLFGITGNPDASQRQVQARRLTSSTPAQSKTAIGTASVSAHAASVGTSGNIAALAINQPCCSSRSIFAKNLSAFTGGQDPQTFAVVQQSDIDGVANPLKMTLLAAAQQSLQMQVQLNERFISTPQCTPNVSSDHAAGDRANNVTVTVKVICTGEVYDLQGVQTIAANLLRQQAATDPGPGYALAGNLIVAVTQIKVTDPNKGTLELLVTAEGIWVFQFSNTQKAMLAKLIAGKSKQAAQTLLLQQMEVKQVDIQLSGGDGKTLPTDTTQIAIDVLTMPGLGSPTVTPTVGLSGG